MLVRWLALRSWILPLVFLTLAGSARAGNIFTVSAPEPAASTTGPGSTAAPSAAGWYGWQILMADAASLTLIAAGSAGRSTPVTAAGLVGWVGVGPVVHLVHRNVGPGVFSVVLRVGLPVLGAVVGSYLGGNCNPSSDQQCGGPALLGLLGGALVAEALDVTVLARDGQPETARPPAPPPNFASGLVVAPRAGGAVAGYCGRF